MGYATASSSAYRRTDADEAEATSRSTRVTGAVMPGVGDAAGRPAAVPVSAALAISTVVITAVARLAYEDFYRATGTTLDGVGLSTGRLLTFGATAVLVLIGIATCAVIPVVAVRSVPILKERRDHATAIAAVAMPGCAYVLSDNINVLGYLALAAVGAVAAAAPAVGGVPLRASRPQDRPLQAAAAVAMVIAATASAAMLSSAHQYGRDFAEGLPTRSSLATTLLDVAAMPVCVTSPQGDPLPGLPPEQLLLGSSAGTHVLLRPGTGARATIVGAASVELRGRSPDAGDTLPRC